MNVRNLLPLFQFHPVENIKKPFLVFLREGHEATLERNRLNRYLSIQLIQFLKEKKSKKKLPTVYNSLKKQCIEF